MIARPKRGRHRGLPLQFYINPHFRRIHHSTLSRARIRPNGQRLLQSRVWRCSTISDGAICFEPGGDFVEGLFIPIVDRDVFAFARFGDLFQQIETRQAVIGFAVGERRGKTVLSRPKGLPLALASASTR